MLLPMDTIINVTQTIPDLSRRDMVLRRILNSKLIKDAEEKLKDYYEEVRKAADPITKHNLNRYRLTLESNLEFLNRESVWMDQQIEAWLGTAPTTARKNYEYLIGQHG